MNRIKKIYGQLSRTEFELIIKLILCTAISMLFTWAIGNPYGVGVVVTANLLIYTDRGYVGGCKYGFQRILVHIVQGLILLIIIVPCKYWMQLPIPDTILMIIAGCFALVVGLPINFKHQYAPYNCTLANATFILMCTMVNDLNRFPMRILECTMGFLIGYIINYVIMPKHIRYDEAVEKVGKCTGCLIAGELSSYTKVKTQLETDVKYLSQDAKRGLKRHKCTEEQLSTLKEFFIALELLEVLNKRWQLYNQSISEEFREEYQKAYNEVTKIHESVMGLLQDKQVEILPPTNQNLTAQSKEEWILQTALWEYSEKISKLVAKTCD